MDSPSIISSGSPEHACGDVIVDELLPIIGKQRLHSRRTHSFSSSSFSSCSSSFRSTSVDSNPDEDSLSSHVTSPQFLRIPFSWEQHPGVPKNVVPKKSNQCCTSYASNDINPSQTMLPLPPAAIPTSSKKFNLDSIFRKKVSNENLIKDPFTTALVECSKDLDQDEYDCYWKKGKISKGISDRFGAIDRFTSCKSSCAVVQSVVLLPRSTRTAYNISR